MRHSATRPIATRVLRRAFLLTLLASMAACGPVLAPVSEQRAALPPQARAYVPADRVAASWNVGTSERRTPSGFHLSAAPMTGDAELFRSVPLPEEPQPEPRAPRSAPGLTDLVAFKAAPFPYTGDVPGRGPFLDVTQDGRRGHRTARGGVLWEEATFADSRVLVHIPAGFDPSKPAAIVVFFHGHGATLARDVRERQQVPDQITASRTNTVLLAPQFALDARDSSVGKFWERGGFARFLKEASGQLAAMRGEPSSAEAFARMPVVLVAYSGGFLPAAFSLEDIAATRRVRGVVLLDALYGQLDAFAGWAGRTREAFFVSAYTRFTERRNAELRGMLEREGLPVSSNLPDDLSQGGAAFLATGQEAKHQDYVTRAWTDDPIADVLARLPDLRLPNAAVAARSASRSANAETP